MLVFEYLDRARQRDPDKVALVCGTERSTYDELGRRADDLASLVFRRGVGKGDRVILFLDNSSALVTSMFGTLKAGACMVLVHPTTPPDHLRSIAADCGATLLISDRSRSTLIAQALDGMTNAPSLILVEDMAEQTSPEANTATRAIEAQEIEEGDLAAIIYTSGSAGRSKGVTLTHRNIDVVVQVVAGYLDHRNTDVILCVLQLSFGYGMLQLFVTFFSGGRLVLERGFGFAYDILKRITTERVTGFAGIPTMYSLLLQLKEPAQVDLSSVRYVTNAAAPLPPSYVPRIKSLFPGARFFLMHGLTECLRTTYLPPEEAERRPTSVGKGMAHVELWLENEKGERIEGVGEGELVVRGPNLMQGYWNDPESTKKVLRPAYDGQLALYTGDLFRTDEDGYLHFVSRMDDVFKCKGEKVSPVEIEQVLFSMEEVAEARVVGVPDDILGYAIRAEIVLQDGASLDERRVKAFCRARLEDHKVPHVIAFVPSIPKTTRGKITRTRADTTGP